MRATHLRRPRWSWLEPVIANPLWLTALVALVVGVPAMVLADGQIRETQEKLTASRLEQQAEGAAAAAGLASDQLRELRDAIVAVAANRVVREAALGRDGLQMVSTLAELRPLIGHETHDLMYADATGLYAAGHPYRPEQAGQRVIPHYLVARIAAGYDPHVSDVTPTGPAATPLVTLGAPVRGPDRELLGIVATTIDLRAAASWFEPLLASFDDVYLLDANGVLMTRASVPATGLLDLGNHPVVRSVLAGPTVTAAATDPVAGDRRLLASRPVADTGWHVIVVDSPAKLDRQVQPLVVGLVGGRLLLLALLLVVTAALAIAVKRMLDTIRHQAITDTLTGLYNRRFMAEQLNLLDSKASRYGRRYSVLEFDLDGLKRVNDDYGHDVGDDLIRQFAIILRASVRKSDVAVRLGGDEFIAILPETTGDEARVVFGRVRERIRALQMADPRFIDITVSAGAAGWRAGREVADLMRAADEQLYEAKRNGRDRLIVEPAPVGV